MLQVFGANGHYAHSVIGAVSVRDNLLIIVDSILKKNRMIKFKVTQLFKEE